MIKAFDVFGVKMTHFRKLSDSVSSVFDVMLIHLSLCATSDIMKTIKSSPHLQEVHTKVMQKCNILWNAASRPKSAEIIQSALGHTLSRPGKTR